MIFKEMHIYFSYNKDNKTATRTIKDDKGNIVYQETSIIFSKAFENDPVRALEEYLSEEDLPLKEAQCCCDRCSNSCNLDNPIRQPRINILRKFHILNYINLLTYMKNIIALIKCYLDLRLQRWCIKQACKIKPTDSSDNYAKVAEEFYLIATKKITYYDEILNKSEKAT